MIYVGPINQYVGPLCCGRWGPYTSRTPAPVGADQGPLRRDQKAEVQHQTPNVDKKAWARDPCIYAYLYVYALFICICIRI